VHGNLLKKKGALPAPWLFIALCTLPALLLTVYFTLWPAVQALGLSFTDATILGFGRAKWVGLGNYLYMFDDKNFLQALWNTCKLLLTVPLLTVICSLILAFTVTQNKLRERGFYRTVFFFPSIVSMTVVSIIWSFVFHPTMGILNSLLNGVGLSAWAQPWVGQSSTALWTIAAAMVWQAAGYFMVMHIAAIDGISQEIYEAATIDGAGAARKMLNVTLPLIKDVVGITFVLCLSGTLNNSYTLSAVMTGGGPNGASRVLLFEVYRQGMRNGNFGYAMAITVFTLAMAVALSLVSRIFTAAGEGR
jgi:N-acetylglucosamine transport system permease protein